jgi:hypothetical protein
MAEDKVKLPRSSYDEVCKIIKAYGRLEKPGNLDQVNSLAGVGKSTVSANNAFLSSIGVIEGGKAKQSTELGRKLAHALEHEIPHEIQAGWRDVVETNEFLRKMALAVRIRKTMEESAFVSHIAYSAGEAKAGYVMTGARAVIDILRASGLVQETDGKLTSTEIPEPAPVGASAGQAAVSAPLRPMATSAPDFQFGVAHPAASVNIEVRIDAKPSDLDDLAPRLQSFLRALAKKADDDADER